MSSASPVQETKAVGMQNVTPLGGLGEVSGAGHVPSGVAARFVGGANAAVREARSVRLTLHERLARKFGDRAALAIGGQKAVVLLRAVPGERIEDVRVVRRAAFHRPGLHRRSDDVGDLGVELRAGFDRLLQRPKHVFGEHGLHRRDAEHVAAEQRCCRRALVVERRGLLRMVGCRNDRCLSHGGFAHGFFFLAVQTAQRCAPFGYSRAVRAFTARRISRREPDCFQIIS